MMLEQVILPAYGIGESAVADSAGMFARFGKKALVVGGKNAFAAALPLLRKALTEADVAVAAEEWYGGECSYANMRRLARIAGEVHADLVIGVGGGKALDTAKGCADLAGLPVVTVPTIAATCAAVTALSVVYDEQNVFVESMFHKAPPNYAVIDLGIIAASPVRYLRAGMGDAIAKHTECTLASRGRTLNHASRMAVALSRTTYEPLLEYGRSAIRDVQNRVPGDALKQVVLSNIVSTGLVSLLIDEVYNGAVAHALFYGMTKIEGFESHVLHGDAVGYGVLVQALVDGQLERYQELKRFCREIGIPVTAAEMGYVWTDQLLNIVIPATLKALNDARLMPYELTESRLKTALLAAETA